MVVVGVGNRDNVQESSASESTATWTIKGPIGTDGLEQVRFVPIFYIRILAMPSRIEAA